MRLLIAGLWNKENKVGFRGYRFSTKGEKGKIKVLKKRGIPVDWIFGGYRGY